MNTGSAKPVWVAVGARLQEVRGTRSQGEMAELLGVHKNTYARWERGEREIGAEGLGRLVQHGWNANWLLTGAGPGRLAEITAAAAGESQALREDLFMVAVDLVDEELDRADKMLPKRKLLRAYCLVYEILAAEGELPEAEVVDLSEHRRGVARGSVQTMLKTG